MRRNVFPLTFSESAVHIQVNAGSLKRQLHKNEKKLKKGVNFSFADVDI